MGTFSTKLELGAKAFGIEGGLDPRVRELTVGQIRICQTHPKARPHWDTDPVYEENYMCFETGVGSGTIWTYGTNIFSNEVDAQRGVIKHQQAAYKERAERDKAKADWDAREKEKDLAHLKYLQDKYGTSLEDKP